MLTQSPPAANAGRPPCTFSETMEPTRVMVVNFHGEPLGMGQCLARHLHMGALHGYLVALDDGTRLSVTPHNIRDPENVVMPPIQSWALNRIARSIPTDDTPPSAA
ncbi:hypothetical protein [Acidocella sp.]|uniref:hypothetical protein n=1 Tax=Acidocella sp. TaxID=50710 RepID=UPI0026238CE3|nr:hypothetical protein [Acidocella sp.]MDD2794386.1 hypothetical protein [Acidocella sp.]